MKHLFWMMAGALVACTSTETKNTSAEKPLKEHPLEVTETKEQEVKEEPKTLDDFAPMLQIIDTQTYFVGNFESDYPQDFEMGLNHFNKISLVISSMKDSLIEGYTIVSGNKRPFKGKSQRKSGGLSFSVVAEEPGDDKYDGVFIFDYEPDEIIRGYWKAYDTTLKTVRRKYELTPTKYVYDANIKIPEEWIGVPLYNKEMGKANTEWEFEALTEDIMNYNGSVEVLKEEELMNVYKGDLEIIRNTIYARHGYSFKTRKIRSFFDRLDWYIPRSVDVRDELSELERYNINLIKRLEDYADRYYDSYGR